MQSKRCKNCTFYSAYYKQWSGSYGKLNHGFCGKHARPQTQFETCEDFKSNDRKEEMRAERRMKSLDNALTAITEIAQILKEKQNEKNCPD